MARPTTPIPPNGKGGNTLKEILTEFFEKVGIWFGDFVNLENGLDEEGTVIRIRKNMRMRGHSAWMLMASIIVASIGLDQNSQAVIIGAMLISPLMSPILGVGLAIGINDKNMLSVSLQHFLVSIIIALFTSYLYFEFSPFGEFTEQIAARTKPNTLDVLIAFFGGVAGIISGSRKESSTAIPGVAIATALMPPLCVTGYGLAHWGENGDYSFDIILNSFYLFFLNAVFVALATYLIVRMLGFKKRQYGTQREERMTQLLIAGFSILMMIPSSMILYKEITIVRQKDQLKTFVDRRFNDDLRSCVSTNVKSWPLDSGSVVVISSLGKLLQQDSIDLFEQELQFLVKAPVRLKLIQTPGNTEALKRLQEDLQEMDARTDELATANTELLVKVAENQVLQNAIDSLRNDTLRLNELIEQARIFLPNIKSARFAEMQKVEHQDYVSKMPTLLIQWDNKRAATDDAAEKLRTFLTQYAKLDTLEVIVY